MPLAFRIAAFTCIILFVCAAGVQAAGSLILTSSGQNHANVQFSRGLERPQSGELGRPNPIGRFVPHILPAVTVGSSDFIYTNSGVNQRMYTHTMMFGHQNGWRIAPGMLVIMTVVMILAVR